MQFGSHVTHFSPRMNADAGSRGGLTPTRLEQMRYRRRRPGCAWPLCATLVAGLAAAAAPRAVAAAPPCPAPANVAVFADNLSADANLTIAVEGELRAPDATCDGIGDTTYSSTFECRGAGVVRCGMLAGLRPGAWVNRVTLTVADSSPQTQAREAVFLGGAAGEVSNALTWTIYPRTFVVGAAGETALRATLDAAASFTATGAAPALVIFDREAFPGASAPVAITLTSGICSIDHRRAGLCVTGSRLVVDALDRDAERGAVILTAGGIPAPLVRLYGADDVFRGLVFQGSNDPNLTVQADTVAITGEGAQRDRLEQCIVRGPAKGDAVSVDAAAGQPVGDESADAVIDDCEISEAQDKGIKVTSGGHVTVRASCVHDNRNGGMQSTLGGTLTALQNLVQHNVPGSAQSGISGGTAGAAAMRNVLVTDGNIVRFSGARGVTAVDAATADFRNDYVADNQFAGARVESTTAGVAPAATFDGVALVCNHNGGITGTCRASTGDDTALCTSDADCCGGGGSCCAGDPGCSAPSRCVPPAPQGFGAVVAACDGCDTPHVELGNADDPGRNALTLNVNSYPNAQGANFLLGVVGANVSAQGNQWEHCGGGAVCDTTAVAGADLQLATGASVELGTAAAARAGIPTPLSVSIGRPRAGDLVRIFGANFNAIDPAACAQATLPLAPCSAENPRVVQANRADRYGNRLVLTMGGATYQVDVDAVTPTMLAFRMPVDCFAPASLAVSKRDPDGVRHAGTIPFCDAGGCLDGPAGAPCDDGDVCSVGDLCSEDGRCVSGPPLDCGGPCMRCDPVLGCVPRPSTASCDDGDTCTVGDHCCGDADVCVPGTPRACIGACLSGVCDPLAGCMPRPSDAACDDGNTCTVGDHCRGDGDVCVSGGPRVCVGQCLTGTCDPQRGCQPRVAIARCSDGDACTQDDHCRGDGDFCLSGSPTNCDDGDPCTIESCDAAVGCRHDQVSDFDAVSCRFVRSEDAITRALGADTRLGCTLGRLFTRVAATTERARTARAAGAIRKARVRLDSVRGRLKRWIRRLPYRRTLPPELATGLLIDLEEALAAADQLRATL
ncbi:MAG: right-handed parallel beta-helix repeat-containing protein [Deltaproteobacteria bacterium]|nr:right-handed parallel beta-helix repeat-containing protein [Deltaproteobacteria bacterium]